MASWQSCTVCCSQKVVHYLISEHQGCVDPESKRLNNDNTKLASSSFHRRMSRQSFTLISPLAAIPCTMVSMQLWPDRLSSCEFLIETSKFARFKIYDIQHCQPAAHEKTILF